MAATSDKRTNNIDTKMNILFATEKATEKALLGPVQGKTAKRIRKR